MAEATFSRLLNRLRNYTPGLFPTGVWDEALDLEIADFAVSEIAPDKSTFNLSYGLSVKSGLHLWNESLHRSHTISQDIQDATGSYWHGIMHRMEGDYGNAKYWFDQAAGHPVYDRLQASKKSVLIPRDMEHVESRDLKRGFRQFNLQRVWDPHLFTDLVQGAVTSGREPDAEHMLMTLQKLEIIMLLEYSYRNASGGQSLEPIH